MQKVASLFHCEEHDFLLISFIANIRVASMEVLVGISEYQKRSQGSELKCGICGKVMVKRDGIKNSK